MESTDAPASAGARRGPTFSVRHRANRALWKLVWLLLASWTPPAFSPWRILLLRAFGAKVAHGAAIAASAKVWLPSNLELMAGASLGPGVECYNMAPIRIGERSIVSQRAFLCGGTHDISDPSFPLRVRPITIGNDAWVASEAFVGPGVRIADGCVLGARSCAFEDTSPWTVYRGNPAKPVRERTWRKPPPDGGKRPLRITCVLGPYFPVPPVRGGAVERIWQNLCEEFAAQGHTVTLMSRRYGQLPHDEVSSAVHYVRLPSIDAPKNKVVYLLFDAFYSMMVCLVLPKSDVTITNSASLPLMIPRSRAGRIYVSVARFPKKQMGFYRRADRLQSVSTHVGRAICAQSPSVAPLVRTIPNAVSKSFAAALDDQRAEGSRQIIFVGRVAREKGIDLLLKAFARLHPRFPDWNLAIVGPYDSALGGDGGDYLSGLMRSVEALGESVSFVGPIFEEAELIRRFKDSAIFVYPSIAAEGEALPLAPVEAMACGCAVVVSSLDCFKDYLVDGVNGLAFDESDGSGDDLVNKLQMLIGDGTLRQTLGENAVRTARQYTREIVARRFLQDFEDLT